MLCWMLRMNYMNGFLGVAGEQSRLWDIGFVCEERKQCLVLSQGSI